MLQSVSFGCTMYLPLSRLAGAARGDGVSLKSAGGASVTPEVTR